MRIKTFKPTEEIYFLREGDKNSSWEKAVVSSYSVPCFLRRRVPGGFHRRSPCSWETGRWPVIRIRWAGEQPRPGLEPFPSKGRGGPLPHLPRPRVATEGQVPTVPFLMSPPSSSVNGRGSEALSDLVFSRCHRRGKLMSSSS